MLYAETFVRDGAQGAWTAIGASCCLSIAKIRPQGTKSWSCCSTSENLTQKPSGHYRGQGLLSTQVGPSQPIERSRKRTPEASQPVKVGHPGRANKAAPAGWIRRIVDARFAIQ